MSEPRVAARDPVFWRWHRWIDDLYNSWIDLYSPPYDFSDAPAVEVAAPILAFNDRLTKVKPQGTSDDWARLGEVRWGGTAGFTRDVTERSDPITTDELHTQIRTRVFVWVEDDQEPTPINYIYPREYVYFYRVRNPTTKTINATFRVFLAPAVLTNSRAHWILMDTFVRQVPPNATVVFSQPCDQASPIRKPATKTPEQMDSVYSDLTESPSLYIAGRRSWPFNLLVPRGAWEGTPYKMFLFVSDWDIDSDPETEKLYGTNEGFEEYYPPEVVANHTGPFVEFPDRRPFGYPFDRPLRKDENGNPSFYETFKGMKNVAVRDVTLRLVDDFY